MKCLNWDLVGSTAVHPYCGIMDLLWKLGHVDLMKEMLDVSAPWLQKYPLTVQVATKYQNLLNDHNSHETAQRNRVISSFEEELCNIVEPYGCDGLGAETFEEWLGA